MMRASLFSLTILVLAGCTNQQIYNAVQENRRMECGKLPQNQYEECIRDYSTSYQEYERARQASSNNESTR